MTRGIRPEEKFRLSYSEEKSSSSTCSVVSHVPIRDQTCCDFSQFGSCWSCLLPRSIDLNILTVFWPVCAGLINSIHPSTEEQRGHSWLRVQTEPAGQVASTNVQEYLYMWEAGIPTACTCGDNVINRQIEQELKPITPTVVLQSLSSLPWIYMYYGY